LIVNTNNIRTRNRDRNRNRIARQELMHTIDYDYRPSVAGLITITKEENLVVVLVLVLVLEVPAGN
jgi:hypothetical protein